VQLYSAQTADQFKSMTDKHIDYLLSLGYNATSLIFAKSNNIVHAVMKHAVYDR